MKQKPRVVSMCPICEAEIAIGFTPRTEKAIGGGVDRELAEHMSTVHGRTFKVRELGTNVNSGEASVTVHSLRV